MAKYTAETLTVEDVRLWYRLRGSMWKPGIAEAASPDLLAEKKTRFPNCSDPTKQDQEEAREIVARELNYFRGDFDE